MFNVLEKMNSGIEEAPHIKVCINVGCLFDITTGKFLTGKYGESILNGGLSFFTGIVGIGNLGKSLVMHFQRDTAIARIRGSNGEIYDTEINLNVDRVNSLSSRIEGLDGTGLIECGRVKVTDKTVYSGNAWYEKKKAYLKDKKKNKDKLLVETPFLNKNKDGLFFIIQPTFDSVDSFTEFETDDVTEMQDKNELGESGGNTIHMRQGLAKLRFLMEAPALNAGSYNYLMMTAHIGKESAMQNAGPGGSVPVVKLNTLKNGDKIKGVTDKFTFLTHNCWHLFGATPLINDSTKAPEFPRNPNDNLRMDTDLNVVKIRQLRGKNGPSGMPLMIIISQEEGVLPTLTEFYHVKEYGRYGIEGNNVHYSMALYPDCKIGRTTVRNKIDTDYKLRRAINITSEMCQMSYLWHTLPEGLLCTPSELYERIKSLGYDWDMILSKTRGWWTTFNDKHELLFLSTMDLLKMANGTYHPYWLEEDKKTIKKEFIYTGE